MKKLYIATTFDKYELPIAVSDSVQGLAEMIGITNRNGKRHDLYLKSRDGLDP